MASVKVVLRKKMNSDGTYPLAVRVTKDRKSSYIYTGQHLKVKDWDSKEKCVRKSHPNSVWLNNYLLTKLSEANQKFLELETQRDGVSSKTVRQVLRPKTSGQTFFAQATIYLNNFKLAGKYNRFHPEQSRLGKFREFLKGDDIAFQDITVPLLNKFKAYLKGAQKMSERSIVNHMVLIRTIYNQAIDGNVVDGKYYPFGKGKISIRLPNSLKIGLTPEEVKLLESAKIEEAYLNHARNVWLFSFYFAGMRVSDVFRLSWSDFQNERLFYSMGKNDKPGSLKIPEKAIKILSQYEEGKRNPDDLIFPELKILNDLSDTYEVQRKISYAVERIDKALKKVAVIAGVEKKMTMHIARHTFGNISGEKIPIQMLQKLYRHSSVTTTIAYQANFIHKQADDALDSVVSF